jgi:cytochrome c oxidase accessory protein FixG
MSSNIPLINVTEKSEDTYQVKDLYFSPKKIYVRKMTGFFQAIRKYSLSFLLLMYFSFAWINIDGQALILFDLEAQKFNLFGMIFWPQDLTLLAFALIISAFGLFFITTLFGRVWCGYSCPQTAWTFIFIWLEEFFEGSRQQRIKLDAAPNSTTKITKKFAKHVTWILVSLATGLTFVAYFLPTQALFKSVLTLSLDSSLTWFWVIFFTAATYINAGWLREQVCIYMCPYARFQSVMFNEHTKIVGYDENRGEPRGSRSRNSTETSLGSCVDCQMCVQVCPVGIDIRNGLQYECIGCALCIDACDTIMEKMNYPKGLIRYASEVELKLGIKKTKLDARALAYGLLLVISIGVFNYLMVDRPQAELSVIRDRGALYTMNGMGNIENYYTLKLLNKRDVEESYTISVEGINLLQLSESKVTVGPGELKNIPLVVTSDPQDISSSTNEIIFKVMSQPGKKMMAEAESKFLSIGQY